MFNATRFMAKFIVIAILALLMLTLFDSNAWWKILFFAIPATLLNLYLTGLAMQQSFSPRITAALQGVSLALLAYLVSLTTILRITFGTLVGFALLVAMAEYLWNRTIGHGV